MSYAINQNVALEAILMAVLDSLYAILLPQIHLSLSWYQFILYHFTKAHDILSKVLLKSVYSLLI